MTLKHLHKHGSARVSGPALRFASRALLTATLVSAAMSAGCGMRLLAHHAGATDVRTKTAGAKSRHAAAHVAVNPAPSEAPAESPLAHLRAAMLAHPQNAEPAYRAALALRAADSLAAAEAAVREAIARDPQHAPSLALLSSWLLAEGRSAEALPVLAIVNEHPEHFSARERAGLLAGLALHQDALGHTREARAALEAAGDDAAAAPVRVFLGARDASSSPADLLAGSARQAGHSAATLNNVGILRLRAGDVAGAHKAFEAAIARDAALPGPYYNMTILSGFYLLDNAAAARWFAAYRARASEDPDSLAGAFTTPLAHADDDKAGVR
jgi:tetratricopeptide (TPR) repeat protein